MIGLPTKKFSETRICESKAVVKSFSDIMKEDNTPYQLKLDIFVYKTNCYDEQLAMTEVKWPYI